MQSPWDSVPRATPEQIAQFHDPAALREDLDAIVALHERTCPNPYLRVSKESIRIHCDRLKSSITRPMTRREFLPLVMELQSAYRSDHYAQGVPNEELKVAFERGEKLLSYRAEPKNDKLVVIAVAHGEQAIQLGDTIVRIGNITSIEHLARLRALVPSETERYRDVSVRDRYRTLAWATGVTLPADVEVIRADGSRHTVKVKGIGIGARLTERTAYGVTQSNTSTWSRGEVLIDSPPFQCRLLRGDSVNPAPIAVIDFPRMDGALGGQWETFLDQAMTAIQQRGAVGLIVDIRANGGGSTQLGDALLARITSRPYRMNSKILWRKSPESDELFRMMAKPMWRWLTFITPLFIPEYTKLEYGKDVVYDIEVTGRSRVEPGFDGPTCLLISDRTFSSAMDLADGVRTYDLMLTLG